MRQASRSDHQRQREQKNVDGRPLLRRECRKTEIRHHLVQFFQQRDARTVGHGRAQANLWQKVTGEVQRDEDGRNGVGEYQHAILRDLGIGDALHSAQYGVDEDDAHAHIHANFKGNLEKTAECHADTAHLADHVGNGSDDQADDSNQSRAL